MPLLSLKNLSQKVWCWLTQLVYNQRTNIIGVQMVVITVAAGLGNSNGLALTRADSAYIDLWVVGVRWVWVRIKL